MKSLLIIKNRPYNKYGIMKGLAITGVVAGHLSVNILEIFVNYWHLPVFFFVSGYFFKPKHLDSCRKFIISRFRRLIIPFVLYSTITLMLHNVLLGLNIISGDWYGIFEYTEALKHLLLLSSNEPLIGAMWFLPSLFIVSIFSLVVIKCSSVSKLAICMSGVVICVAVIFCYVRVPSPYSIWQNISTSWLFILGYYCSKTKLDDKAIKWPYFVTSIMVIILLMLAGMRFGLQASMINTQSILFPIAFIAGIVMINYLSHIITNTNLGSVFGFIGDFSFSIMALHFVGFKVVTWMRTFIDDSVELNSFPVDKTDIHMYGVCYLIVGIVLPILTAISLSKLKNAWDYNCYLQKSSTNC